MALFNPTFLLGLLVLLYLCSFVVFAVIRVLTGVSIQRLGYLSLRRISWTIRDGFRIDIRGLGLTVHRPTFAQPTWISIAIDEFAITIDRTLLQNNLKARENGTDASGGDSENSLAPTLIDTDTQLKSHTAKPPSSENIPFLEPPTENPAYKLEAPPLLTPAITRNGDNITSPIDPKDPFSIPPAPPQRISTTPAQPINNNEYDDDGRSKTWEKLMKLKDRVKRLHHNVKWLRLIDIVATNSSVNLVGVGNVQFGSFSVGVDTRSKLVDRTRFFNTRTDPATKKKQAEWSMTLRSVLFTAEGKESIDIVDNATLNIHGFLIESLDGLRDVSMALKLGRVHIPYDDIVVSLANLKKASAATSSASGTATPMGPAAGVPGPIPVVTQEAATPGASSSLDGAFQDGFFPKMPERVPTFNSSVDKDLMQTIADSKEFVTSVLRGIKEVQFAVSYVALSKKAASDESEDSLVVGKKKNKASVNAAPPLTLTVSMKEVGIDLHRLDSRSPAHRMYFASNDIAHEALGAALSISVGLHDGKGKHERLVYIPMATTTMKTTLPSKTVELIKQGSPEERNTNILFANSVITSPSVDLSPHHIPLLIRLLKPRKKATKRVPSLPMAEATRQHHLLISRLLPKANIKFSMHEPVMRISLAPMNKTEGDESDLIISSISSVSLEIESFHSAVQELHYSLSGTMRLQTHQLYYQTVNGERLDLTQTEALDLKIQLSAAPDVYVVASGNVQTSTVKMVRPEIIEGLRQIVHQLRQDVQAQNQTRKPRRKSPKHNILRKLPSWLLHFQVQMTDMSMEVAGTDPVVSDETRGISIQLDTLTTEYRAQRLDSLQRRNSRRRTRSRSMTPDTDFLKAPLSSSPRKKPGSLPGDGRRLAFYVKGLEAFIIESIDRTEVSPFINVPRAEISLSSTSDTQGPMFHMQANIRAIMVNWSLYRHYAVGIALAVLKKAFTPMPRDGDYEVDDEPTGPDTEAADLMSLDPDYLSPPQSPPNMALRRSSMLVNLNAPELFAFDAAVSLLQVKAELPDDPSMLLQVHGVEVGRHRWAAPYFASRLIRLCVDTPRMEQVWSRVLSVKAARVDYREARRMTATPSITEEKAVEIYAEAIRLAVPYEVLLSKIIENVINSMKCVQQLHYRMKTGRSDFPFDKGPEAAKVPPKISIKTRAFLFEIEDGAFEWKLGMIYRAGQIEQQQRLAREEAFRIKTEMIYKEESRRNKNNRHKRGQVSRGGDTPGSAGVNRKRADSHRVGGGHNFTRGPSYDPEGNTPCLTANIAARLKIAEARARLDALHAASWKKRIDRACAISRAQTREFRSAFWGPEITVEDVPDVEPILEIPDRVALSSTLFNDLAITIDKPSFPLEELPEFMYKVGKGVPHDTEYTLLVPLNVSIETSEARVSLRDYPLPFIHVPSLKPGQSTKKAAFSLTTDFIIAEEYRGAVSTRAVKVDVIKPTEPDFDGVRLAGYQLEVRRTVGAVKTYSNMKVDVNTALPTRITWGPCYQSAIQDMMTVVETFTKPQLDPSEHVGFWDKIRLSFHSRIHVAWRGDGDVHLALKGTRDPYCLMGAGAGFLMCWRNDVRLNLNAEDDPKRFMTVNSGEHIIAIPDYAHLERLQMRHNGEDDTPVTPSEAAYVDSQDFQKVVMKLGGKVQFLIGLVFEQAIVNGKRSFDFSPHYDVVLREPSKALPDAETGLPYDAFRGFRSSHIHLSIAVRAPVDRDWMASNPQPSRSYNTVHMTPRVFTHFYQWLSLFGGPMSLPVRQGNLWPGRDKGSKKFGRHLATLKYNLLLAPLFLTHIYKHKDPDAELDEGSMATGIKVRFESFMLDLHQRREEFNTLNNGRKPGTKDTGESRTSGIKIHAAQLDLVNTDIRAVSAQMRDTERPGSGSFGGTNSVADALSLADDDASSSIKHDLSDKEDDGPDNSRFTIPDNDMTWIDMDDFVELDWILPSERNLDTKILPLAFSPRLTYFRQTDIDGCISGDPDRSSDFGNEPTHFCIMSYDDDPRRVQQRLVNDRLGQLHMQMENHEVVVHDTQVHAAQRNHDHESLAQLDMLHRQAQILEHKKVFLEHMLHGLAVRAPSVSGQSFDSQASSNTGGSSSESQEMPHGASIKLPTGAEFESDFYNRFVIHNLHFKWNNELRNIVLRYFDQVSLRRGLVYYLSRPAVKFILDIVDEQERAKLQAPKRTDTAPAYVAGKAGSTHHEVDSGVHGSLAPPEADEALRRLMEDGRRFLGESSVDGPPGGSHMFGHGHSASISSLRDMVLNEVRGSDGSGNALVANASTMTSTATALAAGLKNSSFSSRDIRRDSNTNSIFFAGADDENGRASCSPDLTSGISAGFLPKKNYHVRLIAPQIQLQSDQNQKNVVLVTSKGMELKVVEVMDQTRLSDEVSGLVQRRFLVNMDSTQFFVTHRKWFQRSDLVAMGAYGGLSYGAPLGSMWPPWVPMEVMFDFETDPFGFKRVVQKTSGMLRYDKFNTLRLKYNDEINVDSDDVGLERTGTAGSSVGPGTVDGVAATATATETGGEVKDKKEQKDSRMDHLWVDFPQARALCNSSQYYAMYVIVLDLLMYNEPTEKTRNERLEKIMLASDFSDLTGIPETIGKMQRRIRDLEMIRQHFQTYPRGLAAGLRSGPMSAASLRQDRLALAKDLAACEEELFFMMKAITSSQRKHDVLSGSQTSTPLLRWSIAARDIVWHLVQDSNEPLVELQLKDVEYHRTDKSDGSHNNLIQVGKILGLNLLPNALYPEIISPYWDVKHAPLFQGQKMIQVYWYMLEAIAGITVMEDFEVNLFPMRIQLEKHVGKKLLEYIFPGMNDEASPMDASPFIIKRGGADGSSSNASDEDEDAVSDDDDDGGDDDDTETEMDQEMRPTSYMTIGDPAASAASLELRLRPTLTSSAQVTHSHHDRHRGGHAASHSARHGGDHRRNQKSVSIRTGASPGTGPGGARGLLLRTNTLRIPTKKSSNESLRSTTPSAAPSIRPGLIRTATMRPAVSAAAGMNNGNNDAAAIATAGGSRFGLRRRESTSSRPSNRRRRRRGSHSDDVTKMMARANKFMAFAHINVPSVLLCLSYKGKDSRNLEDVHDLVFRMPQIEWHNKTWSNLDLVEALKKAVIRALIGHTGAIIGNKLRHRPKEVVQAAKANGPVNASSSVILSQAAAQNGGTLGGLTPGSSSQLFSGAASIRGGYAESAHNISDDGASVFGVPSTAVDFSRSPPRSIRSSNRSVRPRSGSRSSSVHSGKTGHDNTSQHQHQQGGFGPNLMPGGHAFGGSGSPSRHVHSAHEMRPGSRGGMSLFSGLGGHSRNISGGTTAGGKKKAEGDQTPKRPATSASQLDTPTGFRGDRPPVPPVPALPFQSDDPFNPFGGMNTTKITGGKDAVDSEDDGLTPAPPTTTTTTTTTTGTSEPRRRGKFREKLSALSAFAKLGTNANNNNSSNNLSTGNGANVPISAVAETTGDPFEPIAIEGREPISAAGLSTGGMERAEAIFRGRITKQDNGKEEMFLVEDEDNDDDVSNLKVEEGGEGEGGK